MNPFIEYEIKVAIALAVFTLFYKLLLQKDTFHRFNRIVLLVTSALAFALPFFGIVRHETITVGGDVPAAEAAVAGEAVAEVATESGFSFMQFAETAIAVLFFAGAAFMLMRMAYSIFRIRQLIASGRNIPQEDGTTLVVVNDNDFSPVSWMKYIVMSEEDYSSANEGILIHERAHIALGHSWDILFFDLMTVMQWFNPAIWLLKADLRAIHEYEADEAVIAAGTDMREYQLLLVRKAVAQVRYQMANSLTHSTLKNRIKMMSSKKSSLYGALKALYVLPLVAISLIANAETQYDYVAQEPEKVSIQADTIKIAYRGETDDKKPRPIYIVDGNLAESIDDIIPETIESINVIKVAEEIEKVMKEHNLTGEFDGIINVTLKKVDKFEATAVYLPLTMPKFEGGDENQFSKWLNMNLMYPAEAKAAKAEGRVYVSFTVKEDGSVADVKALNNVHPAIDAAVVKLVSSSPEWTPAYLGDQVKSGGLTFAVPVTFDIRGHANEGEALYSLEKSETGLLDGKYVGLNEVMVVTY